MFARSVRTFYPLTGSFFSVSEDRILFLLLLRQRGICHGHPKLPKMRRIQKLVHTNTKYTHTHKRANRKKMGKDLVLAYCVQHNRPFNATNIADALQKEGVKKATAQRYLDNLVEEKKLAMKESEKSKLYYALQPDEVMPKEQVNELELEVKMKAEKILAKKQEIQRKMQELQTHKNQISVKEIREETTKKTKENGEIMNKVKPLKEKLMAQQQKQQKEEGKGEKDVLKEAMRVQKELEKKFVTYCETWLKRKRAFRDITATIVEGSNVKEKDLMKQLEIETDEANGVEEKEFRALLDGLKKKMRADEMNKMMNKKRKVTAA